MIDRIMRERPRPHGSPVAPRIVFVAVAAIALATVMVAILEQATGILDASAMYVVAVVIVGWVGGTRSALVTAIAAFVVYDLLFTDPRFSLAVSDQSELLNLVLVLIVAVAVGRLAALGREQAAEADRRAREATGLFAVSRLLATADETESVAGAIVARLASDAELDRVWIVLDAGGRDRVVADTGNGSVPNPAVVTALVRTPGDEPAHWVRAHEGGPRQPGASRVATDADTLRIRIETEGTTFGSLWAIQSRSKGPPGREATRLLSLAADQFALGLHRDRLRRDATTAEIARRSDALKSALLDSVSHDLRTPLASIRAAAGNLADPDVTWPPDAVRASGEAIDLEAQRLDRFVRSVLDLSRIESGVLRPDLEVVDLRELVERTVARVQPSLGDRPVTVKTADDLPLARVDAVLLDAIVTNLLDNVADHTPGGTPVDVTAGRGAPGRVRLTVEDGGPGVAAADLPDLFEKFHRVAPRAEGSRRGMGVGLSIVRGMAEALGGGATARVSDMGGLAIDVDLEAAPEPPAEAVES